MHYLSWGRSKKDFTCEDITYVSTACRREGIDYCHSLLFGGPGETSETVRETVRLMDEIAPRAVIAMTGIRIYPGTELEHLARSEGHIMPGDSLLNPRFYFSGMEPSMLIKEIFQNIARRKNWFFPGGRDWSSSIGPRLLRLLHREGPLWRTFPL